ncbi:nuclear transport factor 2 family protein [Aureibaculum marinum]|uniref:Nuclear transport factor 2 family protein n=1 Tax=Aureibaculum marinum TaxID=2487930 RepID=A0A3N4NUG4_9FLAO|nr:nuclear transport factor 2 family protein [Aureibaculum marinum]RPE00013.1 nuclear transport factor 2 family protein [Aureibaculum marinum]
MKKVNVVYVLVLMSLSTFAQISKSTELYLDLKRNDSLIFDSSFNTCNLDLLRTLIHENLEFYHDESGVIYGKENFIQNTKNGLCKSSYKFRRELLEETLEVFPLKDRQDNLYGAIQKGTHRFYQDDKRTSIAYFTHLWVYEKNNWLLKRVLSYNHKKEK